VIRAGGQFYLFYLGQDRARRQRLGVAKSPDGITWEKRRANPVLEPGPPGSFDETGLGEPAVWTSGGSWWMLYTGRARDERRKIGLAQSSDGVHWSRIPSFVLAGGEAWNSEVVCDPQVEAGNDGSVRVFYGGGNVARPAESLNGAIGVAVLEAH
jgi:sucrose-6-phosphate hydrolase SacC (GH32 family)